MPFDLNKETIDVKGVADEAVKDDNVLNELLDGILSTKDVLRFNSFKVLNLLSEERPEMLYHKWDFFAVMLNSDNAYHKLIAIRLIANLTKVDTNNKFEKLFNKYYNLLNDSVIIAGHITALSGKIAQAKPKLQKQITKQLLNIDKTEQKHKDLIKAGAIDSFSEYFESVKDKKKIIKFVKEQLESTSPKTKKKAKEFLEKWNISTS